jgi:hypothetical protein
MCHGPLSHMVRSLETSEKSCRLDDNLLTRSTHTQSLGGPSVTWAAVAHRSSPITSMTTSEEQQR